MNFENISYNKIKLRIIKELDYDFKQYANGFSSILLHIFKLDNYKLVNIITQKIDNMIVYEISKEIGIVNDLKNAFKERFGILDFNSTIKSSKFSLYHFLLFYHNNCLNNGDKNIENIKKAIQKTSRLINNYKHK